jgi:hypothetical protein
MNFMKILTWNVDINYIQNFKGMFFLKVKKWKNIAKKILV